MEEEAQPSQGYYLQPVDDGGIRDSKRYVKSPVHSPTSDTSEPPNFGDAGSAHKGADRMGCVPNGLKFTKFLNNDCASFKD